MKKYSQILFITFLFFPFIIHSQQSDSLWIAESNSLIRSHQIEAAYNYLNSQKSKLAGVGLFDKKFNSVSSLRDSLFDSEIAKSTELLKTNPTDRELVKKIAEKYKSRNYLDSAIEILSEYLNAIPDGNDEELSYLFSEYCLSNYDWSSASSQIDKLLARSPDNPVYKLLKAKLCIRTATNLQIADEYLKDLFVKNSNDTTIIQELISLKTLEKKYDLADQYRSILSKIKSGKSEVQALNDAETGSKEVSFVSGRPLEETIGDSTLASRIKFYYANRDTNKAMAELKNAEISSSSNPKLLPDLAEAYTELNQLEKAENIYKQLSYSESENTDKNLAFTRLILLAERYTIAKKYDNAASVLSDIEERNRDNRIEELNYTAMLGLTDALIRDKKEDAAGKLLIHLDKVIKADTLRGELFTKNMQLGDSYLKQNKLDECSDLYNDLDRKADKTAQRTLLNERELFLGDLYAQENNYSSAESVYKRMIKNSEDTSIVRLAEERISWLPINSMYNKRSALSSMASIFVPVEFVLNPYSSFYNDNKGLNIFEYGFKTSLEYYGFMLIGGSISHSIMKNAPEEKIFDSYSINGGFKLSKRLALRGEYTFLRSNDESESNPAKITLDYIYGREFIFSVFYERSDSRLLLLSPYLIRTKLNADHLCWSAQYNYQDLIKIMSEYNYYKIKDGNKGNDYEIRLGRRFFANGFMGYEYYFADYLFYSSRYYTPEHFDTHSLWTELSWNYDKINFIIGGKLGYAPTDSYSVFKIYSSASYPLLNNISVRANLNYGNGLRFNHDYRNFSAYLMLYWGVL